MKIARQVYYSGRVQGIGFRYTVKHLATGFDVTGWVRNLPDGRVELQAGGEAAEVDAFLAAVSGSELAGFIRNVDSAELDEALSEAGFEIRH